MADEVLIVCLCVEDVARWIDIHIPPDVWFVRCPQSQVVIQRPILVQPGISWNFCDKEFAQVASPDPPTKL
eukprot:8218460-Ditylum_brightwellii.AAC.2